MLIESVLLKNKLIEKAIDSTVKLEWVFHMIEEVENEINNKNTIICPKCNRTVKTKPDQYKCKCGARFNVLES